MQVKKTTKDYGKMPEADLDGDGDGDGIHAAIYVQAQDRERGTATVCYAPDAPLRSDGLDFSHEVAHILRQQTNAQMHHPWWHFCGLVGHTFRTARHLTKREIDGGRRLFHALDNEWVVV